jgi:hypothetical protein
MERTHCQCAFVAMTGRHHNLITVLECARSDNCSITCTVRKFEYAMFFSQLACSHSRQQRSLSCYSDPQ